MQAEGGIGFHVFEQALFDHDLGASEILFGGLEHEHDPALQGGLERREELRRTQEDGHVAVMAAGVHDARDGGAVLCFVELLDGQCVHIGPEHDGPARQVSLQDTRNAGDGQACLHLQTQVGKVACDDRRGPLLLEPQLGVGMEIPAQADHLVPERPGDPVNGCEW